jgi:hypothetical protein
MKRQSFISLLLLLLSQVFLTGVVFAHSSLTFTEAATGRRVEFTPFGTLVLQSQQLVSGGWQINYEDRGGRHSAWYFNSQYNANVVPVSLTANWPNGQALAPGVRLYVRAVMRTANGKLTLTQRFIWDVGRGPISSVLTFENTANNPLLVPEVIIWRPVFPPSHAELCPYIPPVDGASIATSFVSVWGQRYSKTTASFTAPLQTTQSRDVPTAGCHGGRDEPPPRPN